MKFHLALQLMAVATVLSGCATTVTFTPVVGDGDQRLVHHQGELRLVSSKANLAVLQMEPTAVLSENVARLGVAVYNRTPAEIEFSTENVTASWKGSPLKVYSFEELIAQERQRQSMQRIGLALQAFGAGVSGGRSTTYETGSLDAGYRGNTGTGTITGTYTGRRDTYDPAAAIASQQAVDAQITAFQAESKASIGTLERTTLRKHTVMPQTGHNGLVFIQMPSPISGTERIVVVVTMPPDKHTFVIDLNPSK